VAEQSRAVLISVCSMAALLRVSLAVYFVDHYGVARVYGSFESCRIAASIVASHGFSSPYVIAGGPTAWLPPVYPVAVAAVFKQLGVYSGASLWCPILLNVLCATLTTALIYRIEVRCFGPMAGFVASLFWAMDLTTVALGIRKRWNCTRELYPKFWLTPETHPMCGSRLTRILFPDCSP
jgi:hypothetical protein